MVEEKPSLCNTQTKQSKTTTTKKRNTVIQSVSMCICAHAIANGTRFCCVILYEWNWLVIIWIYFNWTQDITLKQIGMDDIEWMDGKKLSAYQLINFNAFLSVQNGSFLFSLSIFCYYSWITLGLYGFKETKAKLN